MKKRLIALSYIGVMLVATRILAQKTGDAAKGQKVFGRCVGCHDPESSENDPTDRGPDEQAAGPGFKGLFQREKLVNGKKVTEENVRAMINGGGKGMPAFKEILTDEECANVIAYLKTL